MGKYYRNGRLWSADTFNAQGVRTLAGATESHLWGGANAARPSPTGIQLRFVSTSVEDDVAKQQKQTITVAGTMDPAVAQSDTITVAGTMQPALPQIVEVTVAGTMQPALPQIVEVTLTGDLQPILTDTYEVTVGGVVDALDVAAIVVNGGSAHSYAVAQAGETTSTVAEGLRLALVNGSKAAAQVVVSGGVDADDIATVTTDEGLFEYECAFGDTTTLVATGLKNAINNGTFEKWDLDPTGTFDAGDIYTVTINAVEYNYACLAGSSKAITAQGIVDLINAGAGDPLYTAVTSFGNHVLLTAKTGGPKANPVPSISADVGTVDAAFTAAAVITGVAASSHWVATSDAAAVLLVHATAGVTADSVSAAVYSVDGDLDGVLTLTQLVTGVAAATAYTVTRLNAVLTLTDATPGATTDTVTSSYTVDPGVDSTCVAVHTVTGAAADVAAFTVDGTSIAHTIVSGDADLSAVAVILAAALNGQTIGGKLFSAAAVGDVVTATGPDATAYTVLDTSVNNQGGGVALACTPVTTQAQAAADIAAFTVDGTSFSHVIVAGNDATAVALALQTALDGQTIGGKLFAAAVLAGVITVTGPNATSYTVLDTSVNNQGGGVALTCTPVTTQAQASADIARVTLDAVDYSHTIVGGDTAPVVATALAATLNALPQVNASAIGAVITVTASVAGLAGAYTVVDASVNNQGGGVALSCTVASIATAAAADILSITDGATTWTRTVATAVLATECTALAALIDANAAYIASAVVGVITVEAAVAGVGFAMVDASTDAQNMDLTVTIVTTVSNVASTGIRTIRIDYLDASSIRQSEIVSLNGLTPVLSVGTGITAVIGLSALTFGSGAAAAGTITCKDVAAAITYEQIAVGATQGQAAALTVPALTQAFVAALHLSAGAVATTVRLVSDTNPATGAIVAGGAFVWNTALVGTDPVVLSPAAPWGPFPATARIWLTGTSAAGTACQGTIEGFYEQMA